MPTPLAHRIDHTRLDAETNGCDLERAAIACAEHGFATLCVGGGFAGEAARRLRDAGAGRTRVCAVAGFPLGHEKTAVKAIEAATAIRDGAGEIDFVAHLPSLLTADRYGAEREMAEIVRAARGVDDGVIVKAILETARLLADADEATAEKRIAAACAAARDAGCDYLKTSTGFHRAGGASVEAVRLLRAHADGLAVKASGGIRTAGEARALVEAGADRLGCSRSEDIAKEEMAE